MATKKQKERAKKISIEVWTCLYEHPEIFSKFDLPIEIFEKIIFIKNYCPLCKLFWGITDDCPECPLDKDDNGCMKEGGEYHLWRSAKTNENRKFYAKKILKLITNWNIEKEEEE
jgi:hypothetical protein